MTPLRWPVRVWIVAEILFGLVGAAAVLLAPDRAAENFAWPLRPTVAAAVIGAGYASVAVMLLVALVARAWERVRAVVVAAAMLTALMLIATVLHWDLFRLGSPAFIVWLISYLVPPPTLLGLYLWQQRRAVPFGHDVAEPLPRWWRRALAVSGAAHVGGWSLLFVVPGLLAGHGPWSMSPLFVRVLAAWLVGYGLVQLLIAIENDWRRGAIGLVWLVALVPALAVQLGRYAYQVDWRHPGLLAQLAVIALFGLAAAVGWSGRRVPPRPLAVAAAAGFGAFLFALAVLPALRSDLDVRARWVGEYAAGELGWMMTAGYVALGLGAIALAVGLREAVAASRFGRPGRVLLIAAGVGAFAAALLPQDPTDGSPGTPAGALRELLLIPTFLCLFGALVSIAVALRANAGWRRAGTVLAGATVVVLVALVVSVAVPTSWRGLAGRYFDATWTIALLGLAITLANRQGAAKETESIDQPAVLASIDGR